MSRRKLLRPAVGLVISAACLIVVANSVHLDEVGRSLREANLLFLIPAIPLYFAGTWVRSLRWRQLLREHPVPLRDLFRALVIGLTLNDVLPFRLGELARVFLVARHGVPVGTSLAAIVVERVLDGIALTALLAVGLLLSGATGWMADIAIGAAVLFAVATILLVGAAFVQGPARLVGRYVISLAPRRLHEPLERAMDSGLVGLRAMTNPATALQLVTLSLIAWTLEASMYRVIMEGFRVPGGWPASLVGAGVANLATLVPSAPGYVGTFDAALQNVLVEVFASNAEEALAFTFTVHLVLIVPVVLLGLFFLWQENISLGELTRRPPRRDEVVWASEDEELISRDDPAGTRVVAGSGGQYSGQRGSVRGAAATDTE